MGVINHSCESFASGILQNVGFIQAGFLITVQSARCHPYLYYSLYTQLELHLARHEVAEVVMQMVAALKNQTGCASTLKK